MAARNVRKPRKRRGIQLRSGLEATVESVLHTSKISYQYESTVLKYTQPQQERKYLPDFKLNISEKCEVFLEVKGVLTSADRKKLKLVKEQHPNLVLVMIFGNSQNRLNKKSPTRYSDWCDKHDILWVDVKTFTKEGIACLYRLTQLPGSGKSKTRASRSYSRSSKSASSPLSRVLPDNMLVKGTKHS